ncbi:MAG: zinc ribbon domain-containing protein [Acidobacteriota bacterium]
MFCPTCGRDNPTERKFCASCGTNLEAVSQALSGSDDDFFTRLDTTLDHFLARYAEHVFKNAPLNAAEQRVGKSWQVLGQSLATTLMDLLLFLLMWNIIPLRFLLLLISTPIRLVSERGKNEKLLLPGDNLPRGKSAPSLPDAVPQQWLPDSIGSVTEQTTVLLPDPESRKRP